MVRMKPSFDGSNAAPPAGGGIYDGPPPTPGMYTGTVEKMGLAKINSGQNKGEDRIALLIRISEGKFTGAGVFHSLNLIPQSAFFINQFLHAMTDGSQQQKAAILNMFYKKGYDAEKDEDGKMGRPITVIGAKFRPIGRTVKFVTAMDKDLSGEPRAKISRFLVAVPGGESELEATEPVDMVESADGIGEFAPETTSNPVEESDDDLESVEPEAISDIVDLDDDDDPWA